MKDLFDRIDLDTEIVSVMDLRPADCQRLDDGQDEEKAAWIHENEAHVCRHLAIVLSEQPDETVGVIHLRPVAEGQLAMTFWMRAPYRQMHYMRIAVGALTRYLFSNAGVKSVTAAIEDHNAQAIHVVEHNGYAWLDTAAGIRQYEYRNEQTVDETTYVPPEGQKVLYLCNGCFWGGAKAFRMLDGVVRTDVGYANGLTDHPRYEEVCLDHTGYKECVRVTYDPAVTPLAVLMKAYFLCVDPTVANRQGADIGTQYQAGVYYTDPADRGPLEAIFREEAKKYIRFLVELGPLENFWLAESYHQNYLDKHADGYCHITPIEFEEVRKLNQK